MSYLIIPYVNMCKTIAINLQSQAAGTVTRNKSHLMDENNSHCRTADVRPVTFRSLDIALG
jgi:hypothetical protein